MIRKIVIKMLRKWGVIREVMLSIMVRIGSSLKFRFRFMGDGFCGLSYGVVF